MNLKNITKQNLEVSEENEEWVFVKAQSQEIEDRRSQTLQSESKNQVIDKNN